MFSKDGIRICGSSALQGDPHPSVFRGDPRSRLLDRRDLQARIGILVRTRILDKPCSSNVLELFKNIARTNGFCVRPVEREGRGWARATARVSLACEVGCSVFRIFRKKMRDRMGTLGKSELHLDDFPIPPALVPHPRALLADSVLGPFSSAAQHCRGLGRSIVI